MSRLFMGHIILYLCIYKILIMMEESTDGRDRRRINGAVVVNQYQIQSYVLTTAKYDFSPYEKRLLYLLVQLAREYYQEETCEMKFPRDCRKLVRVKGKDLMEVTIPLASMLAHDGDKNYSCVKKALKNLASKGFEYEDTDSETWQFINIIAYPEVTKREGKVTFMVNRKIWECCLDFTRGYRKYELTIAMKFKCSYSMRFYEIVSNQKKPIKFGIDHLKEMFCITDKYKLFADFRRKVLDSAKKELDTCSPYTFDYQFIKDGKKVSAVVLYPIHQAQFDDPELVKESLRAKTSLSWDINQEIIKLLRSKEGGGFTSSELERNRDLIIRANKLFSTDFENKLRDIIHRSHDFADNKKAYIIGALKNAVSDEGSIRKENYTEIPKVDLYTYKDEKDKNSGDYLMDLRGHIEDLAERGLLDDNQGFDE